MITLKQAAYQNFDRTNTWVGLSTDDKPTTNVNNGDKFIELDTNTTFYYDEENVEWL